MTRKPTYEELEKRVKALEKNAKKLNDSEARYRAVVENRTEMICCFRPDGVLTFVNDAYCRYFDMNREDLIGKKFMLFIPKTDRKKVFNQISDLNPDSPVFTHEHKVIAPNGKICWHKWMNRAVFDAQNILIEYQAVGWDITERVRAEIALQKAYDDLEDQVAERTKELENKTKSLEELKSALEVLLRKREQDKSELENNILMNVQELIKPYIEKIKQTHLDERQASFFNIIERNINEIISTFSRKMSLKYLSLTPTEIQIANLIKHGSSTKEIGKVMGISPRTVDTHRKNIRSKVGLGKKRANLRSFLLSLS